MPSALFGIMSIIAMYFLGRRLFSWREGVYSAALIAIMYPPVYFSQEARMYSILVFLIIVSVYFLIGIVRNDNDRVWTGEYIGYLLSVLFAGATHYFGLFFVGLQSLWMIWVAVVNRRPIACRLKQVLFTHIFLLPLYCLFIYQLLLNGWMALWIKPCDWGIAKWYLQYLMSGFPLLFIVFIELLWFLLIRIIVTEKKRFIVTHEMWLFVWLSAPIFVTIAASKYCGIHMFTDRNLLVVMPAAYLLLARGIVAVPISNMIKDFGVICACIIICANLFVHDGYLKDHKRQYREAITFIDQYIKVDEDRLALCGIDQPFFDRYNTNPNIKVALLFRTFNVYDMLRLTDSGRKNIVVGWFSFYPDDEMLRVLKEHFTILERLDFREVIVMKLALKGAS
jgi:mannosyltransferase